MASSAALAFGGFTTQHLDKGRLKTEIFDSLGLDDSKAFFVGEVVVIDSCKARKQVIKQRYYIGYVVKAHPIGFYIDIGEKIPYLTTLGHIHKLATKVCLQSPPSVYKFDEAPETKDPKKKAKKVSWEQYYTVNKYIPRYQSPLLQLGKQVSEIAKISHTLFNMSKYPVKKGDLVFAETSKKYYCLQYVQPTHNPDWHLVTDGDQTLPFRTQEIFPLALGTWVRNDFPLEHSFQATPRELLKGDYVYQKISPISYRLMRFEGKTDEDKYLLSYEQNNVISVPSLNVYPVR